MQVVASAISKMVASTATYPHEVVRAHMHVAGSGPFAGFTSTCSSVRLRLSSDVHRACCWCHVASLSGGWLHRSWVPAKGAAGVVLDKAGQASGMRRCKRCSGCRPLVLCMVLCSKAELLGHF